MTRGLAEHGARVHGPEFAIEDLAAVRGELCFVGVDAVRQLAEHDQAQDARNDRDDREQCEVESERMLGVVAANSIHSSNDNRMRAFVGPPFGHGLRSTRREARSGASSVSTRYARLRIPARLMTVR